jgi:REase_AHJR-like
MNLSSTTETRLLGLLRRRYEKDGFTFIEYPATADLPAFMHGYRPEALALGDDKCIAIEVKLRPDPSADNKLKTVSERFKGQPDWEFRIVYGDELEVEPISTLTIEQIAAHISEAENLLAGNHARAAFVIGWAAVEALARMANKDFPATGSVRQAVDSLEHQGRLRFQDAQKLRSLLPHRDKIVHGDFGTPMTTAEVEPLLRAARAALQAT